ncbi:MAG: Gfo/Idh/MocA family oxidoreductase [Bacteroidota bacterium]|nr:Gfo/Idh/MocA family oxidoreductase [Bacteroidota bacterium]
MRRKLRMGMIGGGIGAFIGSVHRMAATLDGEIELVCGAFSSSAEKSQESGRALHLPKNKVYDDFKEMIKKEKELPEAERMDFVSIVTPNHLHYEAAKLALENGFHVVCDKPATYTLAEAKELKNVINKSGQLYALTHNYTGYPMVKEAKNLVKSGKLGKIRKIVVEYPQGWLAVKLEEEGSKQAEWRTDPSRAGISNCMGDIGTHAENLSEYITGLKIEEMCADLTAFGEGRELDTDGNILLRFENGAKGILHASQISVGEENDFNIRIYGEKAGLQWHQMEPNTLLVKYIDKPTEIYRSGSNHGYLSKSALASCRIPAGHPEGYVEAFANLYRNFAFTLRAKLEGKEPDPIYTDFPTIDDGIRGMAFIETVVKSSNSDHKWVKMIE